MALHKYLDRGNAAVDPDRKICVVDNVANGFDLYNLDGGHFVRGFQTRDAKRTYPKGVAFANNSRAIVGGSDHGKVYIFEQKTGRLLKTVTHSGVGGVETLAVGNS